MQDPRAEPILAGKITEDEAVSVDAAKRGLTFCGGVSPSTRRIDSSLKVSGYFGLPSVAHYLIFDPDRPVAIHHARSEGDVILTRILRGGALRLDPPGLDLDVADLLALAAPPE